MSATALKLVPRVTEKQCAQCGFILPLDQFGVNAYYLARGARDGRSIYCKGCVRNKVYAGRSRKRQMIVDVHWAVKTKETFDDLWEQDMICSDCLNPYILASRTPRVCRDCEAESIAKAAKEPDVKALSIAELAGWLQSGQRPHKFRRAWVIQ